MAFQTENKGVTTETQNLNDIFAGDFPALTRKVTLAPSVGAETLKRGTVLGKITASGKYAPYDSGASDGSEVAALILSDEVTLHATDDTASAAYRTGQFKKSQLIGIDAAAIAQLDAASIFVD